MSNTSDATPRGTPWFVTGAAAIRRVAAGPRRVALGRDVYHDPHAALTGRLAPLEEQRTARPVVTAQTAHAVHPAATPRVLGAVLRGVALFAVVTGLLDIGLGTAVLTGLGAHLPAPAGADPVLNSQLKYLGAVWAGFGALLWWATHDLAGRAAVLRILLGTVFLGGVGRAIAAARFGVGPPLLLAFIAVELAAPPVLLAWHRRLFGRGRVGHRMDD